MSQLEELLYSAEEHGVRYKMFAEIELWIHNQNNIYLYMIDLENIQTNESFSGEELEYFVDDDSLIGEVYLDGNLIFQSLDVLDEEQLEAEFYKAFLVNQDEDYESVYF